MTDEQINAAIAKACGWTQFTRIGINGINGWMHGIPPDGYGPFEELPNYCTDLNAMHEAEEMLLWNKGPGVWECYRNKLRGKYGEDDIHTTARQRAEAFLRTLGKWEEEA